MDAVSAITLAEGARHLEDLVARARAADEALARVRQGAQPAGDADPYRAPPGPDDAEDAEDDGARDGTPNGAGAGPDAAAGPGSGAGPGR